jgi:hypothetical protein
MSVAGLLDTDPTGPPVAAVWFEAVAAYLCECGCEVDPDNLAAWIPGGDDGEGAVACLDCGERAEREQAP